MHPQDNRQAIILFVQIIARTTVCCLMLSVGLNIALYRQALAVDAHIDELEHLWDLRDQAMSGEKMLELCRNRAIVDSTEFGVQWRCARALWWQGDEEQKLDARRIVFRAAVMAARKAVELNDSRVEGHYWLLVATGNWANSSSLYKKIAEGKKIPNLIDKAEAIDPTYYYGGVYVIRAYLNFEAPWLLRPLLGLSDEDGLALAEKAVELEPHHFFNRIARANGYLLTGQPEKAKADLKFVLTTSPDILPASRIDNKNNMDDARIMWEKAFKEPPSFRADGNQQND